MKIAVFVILLFLGCDIKAQFLATYEQRIGGLCSWSFGILNDSTFCSERGCEATSHFSFGDCKIYKDTILFNSWNDSNKVLINKVTKQVDSSKFIKIIILDNNGKNVTSKVAIAQLDTNGKYYSMGLDSSKTYRYGYRRGNSQVVLKQFYKSFKQQAVIDVLKTNFVIVELNFNGALLQGIQSSWFDLESQKYIIDENGFHANCSIELLNDPRMKENFFWIRK